MITFSLNKTSWHIKIARGLLFITLVAGIFFAIHPLYTNFHTWRQTDMLSVANSYYNKFFLYYKQYHLITRILPSVLNSQDNNGIVAMEFPIINFILSPFFYFGPYYGKVLLNLALITIIALLLYINYHLFKKFQYLNINLGVVVLFIPVLNFSIPWYFRIFPDPTANLLVLTAAGVAYNQKNKYASGILATLGLLIKPTSVIMLLIMLFARRSTLHR